MVWSPKIMNLMVKQGQEKLIIMETILNSNPGVATKGQDIETTIIFGWKGILVSEIITFVESG